MTIYVVTLKTPATNDAEKRADLNGFLKTMKRTFGLRCTDIQEMEDTENAQRRSRLAAKRPEATRAERQVVPLRSADSGR